MPSPIGHLLASLAAALVLTPDEDSAVVVRRPATGADGRGDGSGATGPGPLIPAAGGQGWRAKRRGWAPSVLAVAAAGLLPDLDLLVGRHSGISHSIGAALLVGLATALCPTRHRFRLAMAVGLAYLSHPLLDWLSEDTSRPVGVMALWPFSTGYYHAGVDWFGATDRRYWLDGFWWRNLRSVSREVALLGPVALVAWRVRAHFRRGRAARLEASQTSYL